MSGPDPDEPYRRLAREIIGRACADSRPGVPFASRLEDAAVEVLRVNRVLEQPQDDDAPLFAPR